MHVPKHNQLANVKGTNAIPLQTFDHNHQLDVILWKINIL